MLDSCDSMDFCPSGSYVRGITQARILSWLPFPSPEDFPNPGIEPAFPVWQADSLPLSLLGSQLIGCMGANCFSCVQLCNPMDCSLPGSSVLGISQENILEWIVFPYPEDLPNPGIKLASLTSSLAGGLFTTSTSW